MEYKVGQIFYLVGAETAKVIPFRIIEEVTRTTMEGVEKSFIAQLPDRENTLIDVKKLKGVIFKNTKSLRTHMLDNASNAIDRMIESAKAISNEVFEIKEHSEEIFNENTQPQENKELEKIKEETQTKKSNENKTVKVDIGNGIVANMKASDLEKVAQT